MSATKEVEVGDKPMVKFNAEGLVPAIVQDVATGAILMMAWMNDGALAYTLKHKKAAFYSRSRGKFWVKGESSGHVQEVVEVRVDCDQDTVLVRVKSHGPACHVGYQTCFYRKFDDTGAKLITTDEPVFDPDKVYQK
ncbi:MAG: phosphoribosyl-AMP cyclohydrolase [Planctomycetes bacterium]|nr:phosphoribosyl-AMP cyclohydrolase [Planctomycetota bacterium]